MRRPPPEPPKPVVIQVAPEPPPPDYTWHVIATLMFATVAIVVCWALAFTWQWWMALFVLVPVVMCILVDILLERKDNVLIAFGLVTIVLSLALAFAWNIYAIDKSNTTPRTAKVLVCQVVHDEDEEQYIALTSAGEYTLEPGVYGNVYYGDPDQMGNALKAGELYEITWQVGLAETWYAKTAKDTGQKGTCASAG